MITGLILTYAGLMVFGTGMIVRAVFTNDEDRAEFMDAMRRRPVLTVLNLTAAAPFVGLGGVVALLVGAARRLWGATCGR